MQSRQVASAIALLSAVSCTHSHSSLPTYLLVSRHLRTERHFEEKNSNDSGKALVGQIQMDALKDAREQLGEHAHRLSQWSQS